jgi:hypothetical protein
MKRFLLLVAGLCLAPGLWAATYTYTGSPLTQSNPFYGPCAAGPCANFPAGATVHGWFTTATPLGSSLPNIDLDASVTGYSFTDGINTYSSEDPDSRVVSFIVGTDASGNITTVQLEFSVWKTGSSPHAAQNRESFISVFNSSTGGWAHAYNNYRCDGIGAGVNSNVPDTCLIAVADQSSSFATSAYGIWSSGLTPVVGLWWNPNESGSGYNIDVKHGVLVMTVYSYNKATGEQEWYITSGPITNGSFTGTLNRYVGGQCISCAYNGLPTSAGSAGVVTINFASPVSATMLLPGGRVTNIQPQAF